MPASSAVRRSVSFEDSCCPFLGFIGVYLEAFSAVKVPAKVVDFREHSRLSQHRRFDAAIFYEKDWIVPKQVAARAVTVPCV
ncbi:hypothetical protein [Arthrobacter globiformis]|uniref:hypothetical protein n=1 Tax=Arthrobacter globiformis TaxID=1665 RepID=UPI0027900E6F|nr:hypothetical protein [Arthrobacter globiformis]MDQ0616778.1 hypothetical protein [Arthrobacter globiformis]